MKRLDPHDPYDLRNNEWYQTTQTQRVQTFLRNEAELLAHHAENCARFDFKPSIAAALKEADVTLAAAHLAVKLARKRYEKHK